MVPQNSTVKYQGNLSKWTNYYTGGYKVRWFVLENGILSYYKSPYDYPASCRGSINLKNACVTANPNDKHHFDVIGIDSNIKYNLRADDISEIKRWISVLLQAKSELALNRSRLELCKLSLKSTERLRNLSLQNNSTLNTNAGSVGATGNDGTQNSDFPVPEIPSGLTTGFTSSLSDLQLALFDLDAHENLFSSFYKNITSESFNNPSSLDQVFKEFYSKSKLFYSNQRKILQTCKEREKFWMETFKFPWTQNPSTNKSLALVSGQDGAFSSDAKLGDGESSKLPNVACDNDNDLELEDEHEDAESNIDDDDEDEEEEGDVKTTLGNSASASKYYADHDNDSSGSEDDLEKYYDISPCEDHKSEFAQESLNESILEKNQKSSFSTNNNTNNNNTILPLKKRSSSKPKASSSNSPPQKACLESLESPKSPPRINSIDSNCSTVSSSSNSGNSSLSKNIKEPGLDESSDLNFQFVKGSLTGYPIPYRKTLPVPMCVDVDSVSLWTILKSSFNKDLTKIALPIHFNEPLSMLQRMAEDMEYSHLLNSANNPKISSFERLMFVAAFAVSNYSTTESRVSKPFNPLLGETFELVDHQRKFRYISEQVSHHPPISACHCESHDFTYWSNTTVKTNFWGKSLEIVPEGYIHLILKSTGEQFSWKKVNTVIHNIIVGKLWLDHYGTMEIKNHMTQEKCVLEFKATGWIGSGGKKIFGKVYDPQGNVHYEINGKWNEGLEAVSKNNKSLDTIMDNNANNAAKNKIFLWKPNPRPSLSSKMYNFTEFAMSLNEITPELETHICPTDSRLRPDQRAMENGDWESGDTIKTHLEDKQRQSMKNHKKTNTRKSDDTFNNRASHKSSNPHHSQHYVSLRAKNSVLDGENENLEGSNNNNNGNGGIESDFQPMWFYKELEEYTSQPHWVYKGTYWKARESKKWGNLQNIYL